MKKQERWIITALLWFIWITRAHNIMALPVFVDESLHILRAQMVFAFEDATASFLPGKLLLYYYLGLFNPQDVGGAWLTRQALGLLALPGAALTYQLAQHLFHRRAVGRWALLIYLLLPYLIFFERMALADTLTMILVLAVAIVAVRFAHDPSPRRAVWCGFWVGTAVLAKLTAVPVILLPLIAVWLWGNIPLQILSRRLLLMGAVVGLMLLLPVAYVVYQEAAQLPEKQEVITTTLYVPAEQSRLDQIVNNITFYLDSLDSLFTLPLTLIMLGVLIWQRKRPIIFLLAMITLLAGFVFLASARPSTRYFVPTIPACILIVAYGLSRLTEKAAVQPAYRPVLVMVVAGLLIWGAVLGVDFMYKTLYMPDDLHMTERDTFEYFQNGASGYALVDAAEDLPELTPLRENGAIPVAGFVGACHTLRLYLPADHHLQLECPYFRWRAEFAADTLAEWQQRVESDGQWYFLVDSEQPMDIMTLPFEWTLLESYERPHNGVTTSLYRVETATD